MTLVHNGVAFPALYKPRGLSVTVNGRRISLSSLGEEMLMAWASKLDTPYVRDNTYRKNFEKSLHELAPELKGVGVEDIEWKPLKKIADGEKLSKMPPEKRDRVAAERKAAREAAKKKFGFAKVDGKTVQVAAYAVEPPGIFMGRGKHPRRGEWKKRIVASDVTLNLSPRAPIPKGAWAGVVRQPDATWIASWQDPIAQKPKYVFLHESAPTRQDNDKKKYDKARTLAEYAGGVQESIAALLKDPDETTRRVATVAFMIEALAFRVGDEKSAGEADTVGASTIRVEHVAIFADRVEFDFLGKDSMRTQKTFYMEFPEDKLFVGNLKGAMKGKRRGEQLFPEITSGMVNGLLREILSDLTAKVFRTYTATHTVQDYLDKHPVKIKDSPTVKEFVARRANLAAAIALNHKRTLPKTWAESLARRKQALARYANASTPAQKERKARAKAQYEFMRDSKDYALNTSLKNYIDPRVYVVWGKRVNYDARAIYPATLQAKFAWALK